MQQGLLNGSRFAHLAGLLGPQQEPDQGMMSPFGQQPLSMGMLAQGMQQPPQQAPQMPMRPTMPQMAPQPQPQPQPMPQTAPQPATQPAPQQQDSPFAGINQNAVNWLSRPVHHGFGDNGAQTSPVWSNMKGMQAILGQNPPWASPEQFRDSPSFNQFNQMASLYSQHKVPDGKGGMTTFGQGDVLKSAFPHWSDAQVEQAVTGKAPAAPGADKDPGGGTTNPGDPLEKQFPHSKGKFPLKPFSPIPAGLEYQQARDIISTGGTEQGTKGSAPSQAVQSLEFIRSLLAKAK